MTIAIAITSIASHPAMAANVTASPSALVYSATIQILGGTMFICLGLLLGSTWTAQALHSRLRRQADERRQLNDEWSAIRIARRQQRTCPRCAYLLTEPH